MSFILNRGKSFAAKYKEFESQSVSVTGDDNAPSQSKEKAKKPKPKVKSSSEESISVIKCEPVVKVCDDSGDEVIIDIDLSTKNPIEDLIGKKMPSKGRKRNGKKEKRSTKNAKRDVKPKLMVPKYESESDYSVISENSVHSDSENDILDLMIPDLGLTSGSTVNRQSSPDKGQTTKIKIRYDAKLHRFEVNPKESILKNTKLFYKELGISRKTHELVITLHDNILTFGDTPESLKLTVLDYFEAYTKERPQPLETQTKSKVQRPPNSIEIKLRNNQDGRHDQPVKLYLGKMETMIKLMEEYAKIKKIDLDSLVFNFDGERLTGEETPLELEMDEGSLIDVQVKES